MSLNYLTERYFAQTKWQQDTMENQRRDGTTNPRMQYDLPSLKFFWLHILSQKSSSNM